MDSKDRVEAFDKLAQAAWHSFERRAEFEWKVTFSLWTALGLVAGFALKEKPDFRYPGLTMVILICGTVFLIYVFVWTKSIYKRNKHDKDLADFFWEKIEKELSLDSSPRRVDVPAVRWRPEWFNWSHGSQIAITFLLLALVAVCLVARR